MPKEFEAITQDVLELSRSQRLALAHIIFDLEAGPSDPDAEAAWDERIRTRLKAYDEGRLETTPVRIISGGNGATVWSVKLGLTSNVRREIQEAAEYYEAESPGLGDRFWQEVDTHVRWILANPTIPRLRSGDYRRVNLSVFPYYIAYAIRSDKIVLLAVAHARRRPHYWMEEEGSNE